MKHYFMRHPAVSAPNRCIGQTDISWSAEGRESLPRLIEVARGVAPDLLVTSDLSRCRDFARAAALELDRPLRIEARWREIHFGAWENRIWDEIRQADEEGFEQWVRDYQQVAPPGGESFPELLRRVASAVDDLPRDRTCLIVTHAGCLRAIACLQKVITPDRMFDWEVPYGALFALDMEKREFVRNASEEKLQTTGTH